MSDAYDVVVVGAGTGGYSCALRAAQLGKRVALVERDERLGGTCLLPGRIPTQALFYPTIPSSAVVIGAGAVGLEFASLYRSFGADVTVIEALPRIAPLEDESVSKEVARHFRRRGIQAFAGASVQGVDDTGDAVKVVYDVGGETKTARADVCLVAVGRGPVTTDLGLEDAGVEIDRGFVKVDGQLQSTAPHVWAVGDVAATPLQLAHVAFTEGYAVAERIAGDGPPEIDYAGIPRSA